MNFQVVDTAKQMMKEVNENCIYKNHASIYYQFESKLVRFSDHLPKMYNLDQHENVNEMFFVFEEITLSVYEIEAFENKIYSNFPNLINLEIHVIESEEDKEFVSKMIERFIKNYLE